MTGRGLRAVPIMYLLPALGLITVLSVYPLFVLIRMTFSDVGPTNILGPWNWIGLDNLQAALKSPALSESLVVTGKITAVIFTVNMVVGFAAASLLSSARRSSNALLSVIVFVWALPPLVGGSVWKFLMNSDGAINAVLEAVGLPAVGWLSSPSIAIWSVSAVGAWASLPFAVVVFRGGILSVPREILEAAAIDGAGYWRTQLQVVLPMIRTTTLILATLTLIYAFRSFDIVYVMTAGGPGQSTATMSVFAYQTAFRTFSLSAGASIGFISMCLMLVLIIPYVASVRREEPA